MEMILACGLGAAVFVFCVASFSVGFKFGAAVKEGRQPKIEPVKAVVKAVKADKPSASGDFETGFRNLMMYDGEKE